MTVTHVLAVPSVWYFLKSQAITIFLAVIGIGIGTFFTLRYRIRPCMVYQMHDYFVVGQPDTSSLGEIKILLNGNAVPRVVVTQLAVWNAGNTTVRREDIVESDPLAFSVDPKSTIVVADPKSSIVGTGILKETRAVNDFHIEMHRDNLSRALLVFDYLDAGDGVIFQIIHTGAMNSGKVTGSLRGIPRGMEDRGDLREWTDQKKLLAYIVRNLTLIVGIVAFLASLYLMRDIYNPATAKLTPLYKEAANIGVMIICFAPIVSLLVYTLYVRSRTIPKGLSRK